MENGNGHAKWVIRIVSMGIIGLVVFLLKQDHDYVKLRIQTLETISFSLQLQMRTNEVYLAEMQKTLDRIEGRQQKASRTKND